MNQEKQLNSNGNRRGMSPESRNNLVLGRKTNHRAQKNISITRIQEAMLPLPCPYAAGKTWAEWLAERGLALAGENATYYKELLDRLEGKVTQPIDASVEIGDTRGLTDEQLAIIAAQNIIRNNALEGSGRTTQET